MSRIVCSLGTRDNRYEILSSFLGELALPDIALSRRAPISAACRVAFGVRSLRAVAEHLASCPGPAGCGSDDYTRPLHQHAGTLGAKQALLAILARECGFTEFELVVACCELVPSGRHTEDSESPTPAAGGLPLAVCWLKYNDRRLLLGEPSDSDPVVVQLMTEVSIDPIDLPLARPALYRKCAVDWCRVFNVSPVVFASRRAGLLQQYAGTGLYEDLLGHAIDPRYEPLLCRRTVAS